MRYKEIKPLQEQSLFEINMSPRSLEQLAAKISARAGLEFEMIVPNAENTNSDDYESEPDYDSDEGCNDIDDAVRFFHDGDFNSRSDVSRLRDAMMEDYQEWFTDKLSDLWDEDGEEYLREWIKHNVDEDEWNDPDIGGPDADADTRLDIFASDAWKNEGSYYDDAREEFEQERGDDLGQSEWLEDAGLYSMSDIENRYQITWPHWTNVDNGGDGRTAAEVADSFDNYLGRGVKVGGYHDVDRNTSAYIVEPDGSLAPDDSDDTGLEFVSPPLSIPEMIADLKKVADWAEAEGCYTNSSTGLHMNISVSNFDRDNIDYIKLAVLCGDEYILKEFGRMSNTYCASAISKVRDRIKQDPAQAQALLDQMRSHLQQGADQAVESTTRNIHPNYTQKYTSINLKDNRIEFRSPGGDWLGEYRKDPGKLVNTMLRFVVALDAALDPEKYRKEYLTKLYKLLNPKGQRDEYGDMIEQFARYVTGMGGAPEQVVKDFRRLSLHTLKGNKSWYRYKVSLPGYEDAEVVAQSEEGAWRKAASEWKVPLQDILLPDLEVVNIGKYVGNTQTDKQQSASQTQLHYEVFDREDPEQDTIEVIHGTDEQCAQMLDNIANRRHVLRTRLGIRRIGHTATGPQAQQPAQQEPQQPRQATAANGVPLWEIYERNLGWVVHTFADQNQTTAWATAQSWLSTHSKGADIRGFSCRPKMETP